MTSLGWIILTILLAFELFDSLLEYLNLRNIRTKVPDEFKDLYDEEKYRKSQEYLRTNTRFHFLEEALLTPITFIFVFGGGLAFLDAWLRPEIESNLWRGVAFIATLSFASSILGLPFALYRTFVIEEKFGFNRSTLGTFFMDRLKGLFLATLLGLPLLLAVLWFFESTGSQAWLWIWGLLIAWQVVLLYVAPNWIMPLFNKFEPLPEGELRDKIFAFAKEVDFPLNDIFQMDGSKRSSKANAFFTGFGKNRRIVLFDTLIKNHTVPELVAVLAHEIGHYKHKHILRSMAVSFLMTGVFLYFMNLLINNEMIFAAFRVPETSVYVSLVIISIIFGPAQRIMGIFSSVLSRKHEYEADAFATKSLGESENLVLALKKLTVDSLGNLCPHPWKVFMEYSHPPVLQRIAAMRRIKVQSSCS